MQKKHKATFTKAWKFSIQFDLTNAMNIFIEFKNVLSTTRLQDKKLNFMEIRNDRKLISRMKIVSILN